MTLDNRHVRHAILSVAEQGGTWRGLPKRFGHWPTLYTRMNRWAKRGVRDRVVAPLHHTPILRVTLEAVAVDRTLVQVHPDGTGALKHTARPPWVGPAAEGRPRGIWLPPQHTRLTPGEYARALSTQRTEIERLCRRLKGLRRLVSRFETLEVRFVACIHFALIIEGRRES